ncbi:MAG: hypothetical protein Q7U69_11385 [Sulfuricurvum sp.]|uniref:hypothetical protein n=1 Tax=Sulfuricurvum sp. TaxID=2025608 RepID=UPI0027194E51|nr:hypothetical protein [Sulfuricurvum sp.]MDO9057135.1 hypothetical protein [Sulfuricurvum sp.]
MKSFLLFLMAISFVGCSTIINNGTPYVWTYKYHIDLNIDKENFNIEHNITMYEKNVGHIGYQDIYALTSLNPQDELYVTTKKGNLFVIRPWDVGTRDRDSKITSIYRIQRMNNGFSFIEEFYLNNTQSKYHTLTLNSADMNLTKVERVWINKIEDMKIQAIKLNKQVKTYKDYCSVWQTEYNMEEIKASPNMRELIDNKTVIWLDKNKPVESYFISASRNERAFRDDRTKAFKIEEAAYKLGKDIPMHFKTENIKNINIYSKQPSPLIYENGEWVNSNDKNSTIFWTECMKANETFKINLNGKIAYTTRYGRNFFYDHEQDKLIQFHVIESKKLYF